MTELRKNYLTDADTGRTAVLDGMSDALQTIDYGHHEIHSGSSFHTQVYTAAGAAVSISFATPAGTKRAHMTFSFASESKSHLTIAEGATWTTNTGTVVVPVNQLREAAPGASVLLEDKTTTPNWSANGVLTNVTAVAAGTAIRTLYVFGDKRVGALASHSNEIILKPDETYTITLTSDDGNKGLVAHLDWYEHTDKI